MALLPGSPAIGKGIAVSGVTTDQRGFPLDSPKPDIGAFQVQPGLVVNTTIDGTARLPATWSLRQAIDLGERPVPGQSFDHIQQQYRGGHHRAVSLRSRP